MEIIKNIFKSMGYVRKDEVFVELNAIANEIAEEIERRPQYPNVGKKGCLRRIMRLCDYYKIP